MPLLKTMLFMALFFLSDRLMFFLISGIEYRFLADLQFKEDFSNYVTGRQFSTLILGTSRTLEAIHPAYFKTMLNENAYREAQFGKGPEYNYLFYKFFKQRCGTPEVLIYGLDYFMFNIESRIRWLYRFKFKEKKDYIGHFSMLLKYKKNIDDLMEVMVEKLKQFLGETGKKEPMRSFIENQTYLGVNFKQNRINPEKPDRFNRFRYIDFPGKEGAYFLKLLEDCRKDGVKVILVFIPDYYGTNVSNKQRHLFHEDITKITDPFDNIFIYNYNKMSEFPLHDRDNFINGGYGFTNSHMSKKGAALFHRLFLKDIEHHYDRHKLK